jgi:hypothetical protein
MNYSTSESTNRRRHNHRLDNKRKTISALGHHNVCACTAYRDHFLRPSTSVRQCRQSFKNSFVVGRRHRLDVSSVRIQFFPSPRVPPPNVPLLVHVFGAIDGGDGGAAVRPRPPPRVATRRHLADGRRAKFRG